MCIGNEGQRYYYANNPQSSPKNQALQTNAKVCDHSGPLLEVGGVVSNIFSQLPSSSRLTARVVNSLALSGGCTTRSRKSGAKIGGRHLSMEG